jgi:ABC-type transporter Mla MlaB component
VITIQDGLLTIGSPITFQTYIGLQTETRGLKLSDDIEVDLGSVGEIDSCALAYLFFLQRLLGRKIVTLRNPPESLLSLAQLYGVYELFEFM